jgi:hypothetical protein
MAPRPACPLMVRRNVTVADASSISTPYSRAPTGANSSTVASARVLASSFGCRLVICPARMRTAVVVWLRPARAGTSGTVGTGVSVSMTPASRSARPSSMRTRLFPRTRTRAPDRNTITSSPSGPVSSIAPVSKRSKRRIRCAIVPAREVASPRSAATMATGAVGSGARTPAETGDSGVSSTAMRKIGRFMFGRWVEPRFYSGRAGSQFLNAAATATEANPSSSPAAMATTSCS